MTHHQGTERTSVWCPVIYFQMKKRMFSLVFPFRAFVSFGQSPGFNEVFDLGYPTNHLRDMILDGDTIVGYGLGYNDTISWQQGLLLMKFDSSGTLLTNNIILDSLEDHLSISKAWGKIINTTDGG